jgi:hypothetical protein
VRNYLEDVEKKFVFPYTVGVVGGLDASDED